PRTRSAMASRLVRLVSTSSAANAWMLCPTLGRSSPSVTWETCALARNRVLAAATASLRDNSVRPLAATRIARFASTTILWSSLIGVGIEQNEGAWSSGGVVHGAGTHGQRYPARPRGRTQTSKPVLLRPNPRERAGDEASWAHEQHRRVPGRDRTVEQTHPRPPRESKAPPHRRTFDRLRSSRPGYRLRRASHHRWSHRHHPPPRRPTGPKTPGPDHGHQRRPGGHRRGTSECENLISDTTCQGRSQFV